MIKISQTLSKADYEAAARIHYRTYRLTKYRPWLAGVLICLGIFLLVESSDSAFGIFSVAYGAFMLFRKKIWIRQIVKSAATSKRFGDKMLIHANTDGVISFELGKDHTQMQVKNLFGFIHHPIGFLLYSQRNLFYFLKAEAFESKEQMETMYNLLRNNEIKELQA